MCAADTRYFCQPSRLFKTFPVKVWRPSEPVKEPIHSSRALKHSLLRCSFLMPSSFTTRWLNIMAVNSVLGVRHTGIGLLSFMMLRQLHHSVVNTSWIRVGLDRDTYMTGRSGRVQKRLTRGQLWTNRVLPSYTLEVDWVTVWVLISRWDSSSHTTSMCSPHTAHWRP